MKYKRYSEKVELKIEFISDLIYIAQIIQKNDYIEALDFRRPVVNVPRLKETRLKLEPVIIKMHVRTVIPDEEGHVFIQGAIDGSSFHRLNVEPGTKLTLYRKLYPHEIALIKYSQSTDQIYVLVLNEETFTVLILKDYIYEIVIHQDLDTQSITASFKKVKTVISKINILELIVATNSIFYSIFSKLVDFSIKLIPYYVNVAQYEFINHRDFYKSSAIKKLQQFKVAKRDLEIFNSINEKFVFEGIIKYLEFNLVEHIFISILEINKYFEYLKQVKKFTILSPNFFKVYSLPPVFVKVYYRIYE